MRFSEKMLREFEALDRRRDEKLQEIVCLLARQLGYGEFETLSVQGQRDVTEEAEACIERWMEDAEMADEPPVIITPLQRLLREHHDLGEDMVVIQDDAVRAALRRYDDYDDYDDLP